MPAVLPSAPLSGRARPGSAPASRPGDPELALLWRRLRARGDQAARARLIENYGYLVRITAARISAGSSQKLRFDREDLASAGTIGLIRAVDQYDPDRKVKFETYAIALIRGAILELLRGEDWVPRSVRDRIKLLERTYASVEMRLGRPGTEEEVAEALGTSVDDLNHLLLQISQASVFSLDDLLFGERADGGLRLGDTLEDTSPAAETGSRLEQQARREALQTALKRLPERENLVLCLYYYEGLTFKEVGKLLQVSESRSYQLHQQAILRLRGYLTADVPLFE